MKEFGVDFEKRKKLKIALTNPNFWPYFRRGSTRFINDLSKYLIRRGHQVDIITSKPGRYKVRREGNLSIVYHPWLQHPLLLQYRIWRVQTFSFSCLKSLMKGKYDIIYCVFHSDGFAASINKVLRRTPYIFQTTSVPFSTYFGGLPVDKFMFKRAVRNADCCLFPSRYAQSCVDERLYTRGAVIPMGVDISAFCPCSSKDLSSPRIFCSAALQDSRKGVGLLVKAFENFLQKVPSAKLQLSGQVDFPTEKKLLSSVSPRARERIEILGTGKLKHLPRLYAEAAMTVLPSVKEVFGMALIESLASGTPVVGSRSGAIPEIIDAPSIGSLFDPHIRDGHHNNVDGLTEAMLRTLELAHSPDTVTSCRERAQHYSWEKVGSKFEELFYNTISSGR